MTVLDFVLLAGLAAWGIAAVRAMRKGKGGCSGCSGCGQNCNTCTRQKTAAPR